MTNSSATPEQAAPPGTARRPLARSRDDRVLAGVCGGVGRYLGVDPVLFRVLLPVLAVFGGSGIVLYALGWLLIPEEGAAQSEAQRLVHGRGSGTAVLALIAVAVGVLAVADLAHPGPSGGLLLAALVVALVLYARRGRTDQQATDHHAAGDPPETSPAVAPETAVWTAAPGAGYPVPPPPRAPRERSPLGLVTVSVALLATGLLLVADRAGVVAVGAPVLIATALAIVGAGLVVGAWLGRARWLVAVGVALAVALLAVDATPRMRVGAGMGDRAFAPAALADVRPAYRLGIGDTTLDLSRVPFAGGRREVAASVGVGDLSVVVPRTVDITVHGRVGLGQLRVFDTSVDGSGLRRTVTLPAEGTSQGSLDLSVEVGVGQLEVRHATA